MKDKAFNKKRVLIYAHYYYPDVASTGQILQELAEGMLDKFHITVICAVPSYGGKVSDEYKGQKYYTETLNGVDIIRVAVPEFNKAQKLSRVRNILAYFLRAMKATRIVKHVDYVYSISQPPILGGMLGVYGKKRTKGKFIYNIQDFNPEQVIATGFSKFGLLLKCMMWFDKRSCRHADKVIVVGRDMVDTLKERFKGKRLPSYTFINNWIDEKEIYPLTLSDPQVEKFRSKYGLEDKFVFMYSGNLGLYYDLENLMRVLRQFPIGTQTPDGRDVVFAFIGDGSIKEKLLICKEEYHLENVVFLPYQDKAELNYSLNAADIHMCVSAQGIKGVSVPSKLYGEMATAKPVLGVMEVGAEGRLIIEETQCGRVSEPGEYNKVETNVRWFIDHAGSVELEAMGNRGRDYLVRNLTKRASIKEYMNEIESLDNQMVPNLVHDKTDVQLSGLGQ
jgi:glycosyltransferase involved in cell wall biosynthesis